MDKLERSNLCCSCTQSLTHDVTRPECLEVRKAPRTHVRFRDVQNEHENVVERQPRVLGI
jgi:hypothetical protein